MVVGAEEALSQMKEWVKHRGERLKAWKEATGGKIVGSYFYAPEELIHAAGALPVGLWGYSRGEISKAGAHLQPWTCSLARGILELALNGALDLLDGIVFPSTCDAMQQLAVIWQKLFPATYQMPVVYPFHRQSPSALSYLLQEFEALKANLERLTGMEITDSGLQKSIALYEESRALIRKAYELNAANPVPGRYRAIDIILRSSQVMPRKDHNVLLRELIEDWEQAPSDNGSHGRLKVLLSGIISDPPGVLDLLEELGCAVVADDLALGSRLLRKQVTLKGPPIADLAEAWLNIGPCSTLYDPKRPRGKLLAELAARSGARAVIVLMMKFCEPEGFEYPILKKDLEQQGIPVLMLEVEQGATSLAQLRTRLQAFVEMVA